MNFNKLLFDNNALDLLLTEFDFFKVVSRKYELFVSDIAYIELNQMTNELKKKMIIKRMIELNFNHIPHPTIAVSNTTIANNFEEEKNMKNFATLGDISLAKKVSHNQLKDFLISDTALKNDCILITRDKKFYNLTKKIGIKVMNLEDLKNEVNFI